MKHEITVKPFRKYEYNISSTVDGTEDYEVLEGSGAV
jgi:hypothetical protein